jgi:hypothetical protein
MIHEGEIHLALTPHLKRKYTRRFLYRSLQFCLLVLIVIFLMFAARTILDPYYRNHQLLHFSQKLFLTFTWPFELCANHIQSNPGLLGFPFHPFWTSLGIISNLLYLMILGNCLFYVTGTITRSIKDMLKVAASRS